MEQYDAIAEAYRDSKQLPFREVIERHTLFEILGDIRGEKVLDMACGDGFYTRLLKRAGAAEVTGVDVSVEMIRLAEEEERKNPLRCTYLHADAAAFEPPEPVDLVVAMYLLNYARTREQLGKFCRVCHDALRPGGCFTGVNDNVRHPPGGVRVLEEIRPGEVLSARSEGGGRHSVHRDQRGRAAIRVRKLLPRTAHLRASLPRSRIPGLPMG